MNEDKYIDEPFFDYADDMLSLEYEGETYQAVDWYNFDEEERGLCCNCAFEGFRDKFGECPSFCSPECRHDGRDIVWRNEKNLY